MILESTIWSIIEKNSMKGIRKIGTQELTELMELQKEFFIVKNIDEKEDKC